MAHRIPSHWEQCDICLIRYDGPQPAVPMSMWPPGGWHYLDCSGGGCGSHVICPPCEQQFAFTNVLGIRLVKCFRHLTDEERILVALRGMT